MALRKDHVLKVLYTLDRYDTIDIIKEKIGVDNPESITSRIEKDFLLSDVYCKINSFSGNKEQIHITLGIYKNESKEILIDTKTYVFTPCVDEGSANALKQGYEYLKTLPEYADAIDC